MAWLVKCSDTGCGKQTWVSNIVDLIAHHLDANGRLLCPCGKSGYVEKKFFIQEPGETFEPFLRGIVPLGTPEDTYQPFVFLVSYKPDGEVTDIWFSYYKDLRDQGGRLKLGYGPGGPPVLGKSVFLRLISRLVQTGYLTREDITATIGVPELPKRLAGTQD